MTTIEERRAALIEANKAHMKAEQAYWRAVDAAEVARVEANRAMDRRDAALAALRSGDVDG